jgi:hypothetical protein
LDNGINFVESPIPFSSILTSVSGTLTNANLKSLASGLKVISNTSGHYIVPVYIALKFYYGGNNAFTGGANLGIYYGNRTFTINSNIMSATEIKSTSNQFAMSLGNTFSNTSPSWSGDSVYLSGTSNFTGNASNDNTINYIIYYYLVPV